MKAITQTIVLVAIVLAGSRALESLEQPPAVECSGVVLSRGQVNFADHEIAEGSWNLGQLTVIMPVGAVSLLRVKDLQGKDAELMLRPIPQRTLETIR